VDSQQTRRSFRREFIRAHHPDRGGDYAAFAAGLAELDQFAAGWPATRVVVVADTPLLVSLLTALMHWAGWRRPPPRVR
jgi:transposase